MTARAQKETKDCGCSKKDQIMAKQFGRARVQPDGSIMYPKKGNEPPPDLDGFKRDPGNAWRFLPLWQACNYRMQSQYLKSCGALGVLSLCTHPQGPRENERRVEYSQCAGCHLIKYK